MIVIAAFAAAALAPANRVFPTQEARQMVAVFADCIVGRAPRKAKKIVMGELAAFRVADENFNNIMESCLATIGGDAEMMKLNTQAVLLRFAFAEAFLRKEPALSLPPLQSVPRLKHATAGTRSPGKSGAFETAVSSVGECVVRAAPDTASRLVHSAIGTPAETSAFAAITPALSSCLSAGQTFAFSPELLRGTVALNYYRLAMAAGATR